MLGLLRAVGVAILAIIGWMLWNLVPASGVLAELKPKLIEECRPVAIFPGTEDVTIDPDTSIAFISADDRRATRSGNDVEGGIYALRLDGSDRVSKVSPISVGEFHPHGISLWRGADGRKRLFVINHRGVDGHSVEIFDVGTGGALMHVDTVAFPEMSSPNDVVGVGPRSFYVTNDRAFRTGVMADLEAYLALPLSTLAFFDGQNGRIVARGLSYANGINASSDGKTIYASALLQRSVTVYDRDPQSGDLSRRKSIRVNTAPDNIEIASDGALWVAGHSKVFDFLKHVEDPSVIAPSHVVRVNPDSGVVEDMFIDTTGAINASSVGAVYDETLVVGSVFDDHVMVCPSHAR